VSFYNSVPAVGIGCFAKADCIQVVVKACGDRAGFAVFRHNVFDALVEVVDLAYWGAYGCCAAGCRLGALCELFHGYRALFDFYAHIARYVHKAHIGDGGQD